MWGNSKGLYLDKGFNVKFIYDPKNPNLPTFAVGLDDFAGQDSYPKNILFQHILLKLKLTSGVGWGKFVGDDKLRYKNPLSYIKIPLVIDKKVQITILVDLHHMILGLRYYFIWRN